MTSDPKEESKGKQTDSKSLEHHYRDHSHESEDDDVPAVAASADQYSAIGQGSDNLSTSSLGTGDVPPEQHFAVTLHLMLDELEKDGLNDIVSWLPHGRCFMVRKPKVLVKHVLPKWFRQTKFASFQRQLNLYGFRRLTAGRDKGAYYHELFLRGKRFLAHRMKRIKIKGTGARQPSSPETEPNFYIMPMLPPTRRSGGLPVLDNSSRLPTIEDSNEKRFVSPPLGSLGTPQSFGASPLSRMVLPSLSCAHTHDRPATLTQLLAPREVSIASLPNSDIFRGNSGTQGIFLPLSTPALSSMLSPERLALLIHEAGQRRTTIPSPSSLLIHQLSHNPHHFDGGLMARAQITPRHVW